MHVVAKYIGLNVSTDYTDTDYIILVYSAVCTYIVKIHYCCKLYIFILYSVNREDFLE